MRTLFTKPQYWCAILLEVVIFSLNGKRFYEYAGYLGERMSIYDIFLYTLSDVHMMILLVIGCILLFSDIPFKDEMSKYVLLRSGKREYYFAKCLHLLFGSFLYYIQGFIVCVILTGSSIVTVNAWSIPMYELAKNFKLGNTYFQLQGFPYQVLQVMNPLEAFKITFLLVWLYSVLLLIMFYGCSLIMKRRVAFTVIIMFHLSGLLFLMRGNFYFLLSQVLLEYHSFGIHRNGPSIRYTIVTDIIIIILLFKIVEGKYLTYDE